MTTVKKFSELINNTFEISQTKDGVKTVYVSGDDVKLYVNKHYGTAYCYYDNTSDLKSDFDHFNRLHVTDFIRLLEALKFEYNPCENYDKYSDITVSHTGTIGTQSGSTMTSKVNAFDNSSLVTDGETIGSGENTTTLNNSDGTTEHTHGNVGVQTVSNMILQSGTGEAYLRFNSFVEHYLNRWVCGCIVGYGDEENEIEVAPSTEYATKTELNTLAQSTGDALNSLTNTVNAQGTSITTIDNSLGGVIEDLEDLTDTVENVDDRLTANNTPIYLDYHDGKYGYNTSSTRGADTFTPFSSGGGGNVALLKHFLTFIQIRTTTPDYTETGYKGKVILFTSLHARFSDMAVKLNGTYIPSSQQYDNGRTDALKVVDKIYFLDLVESDILTIYARHPSSSENSVVQYDIYGTE